MGIKILSLPKVGKPNAKQEGRRCGELDMSKPEQTYKIYNAKRKKRWDDTFKVVHTDGNLVKFVNGKGETLAIDDSANVANGTRFMWIAGDVSNKPHTFQVYSRFWGKGNV